MRKMITTKATKRGSPSPSSSPSPIAEVEVGGASVTPSCRGCVYDWAGAGLICTVNACAVSITDGTAANDCDAAAIRYVDILDVCNNEFIIRVSPVLCNTVLVSNCNEGEERHHVVIAVVPGVAS